MYAGQQGEGQGTLDLVGKTAMVTGAGRGIGRAIAMTLASRGAGIVALDIVGPSVDSLSEELRRMDHSCLAVEANVASASEIEAAVSTAVSHFGSIDILVNNAGVIKSALLADLDEEGWDWVIDVNIKGVWLCTRAVVPHMIRKKWGRVINISSMVSKTAEYGNGVYCVSKAGVSMMTQAWALELAEYNINVNAICPGFVNTEMMQNVFKTRGPLEGMTPEEYERALVSAVPLKRMAQPSEIAELVAFLAGEAAAFITGTGVVIAGGKELH